MSAGIATVHDGAELGIDVGTEKLTAKAARTSDWSQFRGTDFGQVEIKQAGEVVVAARARDAANWKAVNLRAIKLTRQP